MKRQILTALVLASCGPSQPLQHPSGEIVAVAPKRELRPLALELTSLVARGDVAVKDATGWQPLAQGAARANVTEVRATRRAAMLAIGHGDAAGRLWLRAGTRVTIGHDDAGIHIAVLEGRARLRRTGAAIPVFVGQTAIDSDFLTLSARLYALPRVTTTSATCGRSPRRPTPCGSARRRAYIAARRSAGPTPAGLTWGSDRLLAVTMESLVASERPDGHVDDQARAAGRDTTSTVRIGRTRPPTR